MTELKLADKHPKHMTKEAALLKERGFKFRRYADTRKGKPTLHVSIVICEGSTALAKFLLEPLGFKQVGSYGARFTKNVQKKRWQCPKCGRLVQTLVDGYCVKCRYGGQKS